MDDTPLPTQVHLASIWYPAHPFTRPRDRQVAFLATDMQALESRLTNAETGETWTFPFTYDGYEDLARTLASHKLTAFSDLQDGTHRFAYLPDAIHDEKARVYASEEKGVIGMSIQRGKRYGSVVSGASWHRREMGGAADAQFADDLRRIATLTGVGIFDTPCGLGSALLRRVWTMRKLEHVLKLPHDLDALLRRYSTGGLVTDEGLGRTFPLLNEGDIRQAYPATVGLGLPWGSHIYTRHDPTADCRQSGAAAFGYWTLYVTTAVEHSPIPDRDWTTRRSATSWSLGVGRYEYAGWLDEIEALRQTGHVIAVWHYGWVWGRVSDALKPWVDEMASYRAQLELDGQERAAGYLKLATNATIGSWGMDPIPTEVVPIEHARLGDGCFYLPKWCFFDATNRHSPPEYITHRAVERERTRPMHWASYVRMKVRMEVYRVAHLIRQHGGVVVAQNFDALQSTDTIPTEGSAYTWKTKVLIQALKPYPRATVAWEAKDDGTRVYTEILPGVPKAARGSEPEKARGP